MTSFKQLVPPVSGRFTDGFGPRGDVPGLGNLGFHTGQDIAAPPGTPILAAHDGVVSRKWWDAYPGGAGAGGWMIEVRGDDGLCSRYAHMRTASTLSVGARVAGGQSVVGEVGDTGAATAAHLHFEVLRGGEYIDPAPLLQTLPPPATAESEDSMLYLMIIDGKGRYGKAGGRYFATYDGRVFMSLTPEDANAIANTNLAGRSFANITYQAWEGYQKAAQVVM